MKNLALIILFLLTGSAVMAQSYDMTIHLSGGESVTISTEEILSLEFVNLASGVPGSGEDDALPQVFRLLGNYPNPFNPCTTIRYQIPAAEHVRVSVFDLRGAVIRQLVNENQEAGLHEAVWAGTDSRDLPVASGVYLYAVESGGKVLSRPMILVK